MMQEETLIQYTDLDRWLQDQLKPNNQSKLSKYKKSYFSTLYLNGALGSIWTIPITFEFWKRFLDNKSLGIGFTIISGLSSIFLFSRLTDLTLKKLFSDNTNLIQKKNSYYQNFGWFILTILASAPATIETFFEFEKWGKPIAIATTSMTAFNIMIMNFWSLTNAYNHLCSITDFYHSKDEKKDIYNFLLRLNYALESMSQSECHNIIKHINEGSYDQIQINLLRFVSEEAIPHMPPTTPSNNKLNYKKYLILALGFLIGAAGAWYSFKVPDKGINQLMTYVAGSNTAKDISTKLTSIPSYIANAALFSYTTSTSFLKFYNNMQDKICNSSRNAYQPMEDDCEEGSNLRSIHTNRSSIQDGTLHQLFHKIFLPLLYTLVAFCGSAAVAEMTEENVNSLKLGGALLIASSFLGMFSSKYWATSSSMKEYISSTTSRDKLKQVNDTLFYSLPKLKDDVRQQLFEETSQSNPYNSLNS